MKNSNTWNYVLTVIIPLAISLAISIASFLINAKNTGKKIEKYKFMLGKKEEEYTKTMEIYSEINNLADFIIQGYMANQTIEDRLIEIEDILRQNDVYLSKEMYELYYEIYNDMEEFSDILDNIKTLKRNLSDNSDTDKLQEKGEEEDKLRRKIDTDLKNIKETIRKEYKSD